MWQDIFILIKTTLCHVVVVNTVSFKPVCKGILSPWQRACDWPQEQANPRRSDNDPQSRVDIRAVRTHYPLPHTPPAGVTAHTGIDFII